MTFSTYNPISVLQQLVEHTHTVCVTITANYKRKYGVSITLLYKLDVSHRTPWWDCSLNGNSVITGPIEAIRSCPSNNSPTANFDGRQRSIKV